MYGGALIRNTLDLQVLPLHHSFVAQMDRYVVNSAAATKLVESDVVLIMTKEGSRFSTGES